MNQFLKKTNRMNSNLKYKQLPPQIFNLKAWIKLVDEIQLKNTFSDIIEKSGFISLNYSSHQFPMNGFTAFWLLAESHLALHTFTESGWCYLELSSCNASKAEIFKELTNKLLFETNWENANLEVCNAEN